MSGKNLRKPKWNLSELPQFEKNFYREHINVQNRSAEEIASYRNKREITLVGRNVPKPVFTFEEAGFPGKKDKDFICDIFAHFLSTVVAILGRTSLGLGQTDNFAKCAWKMRARPLFLNNKLLFFLELRMEDLPRARHS